MNQKTTDRLYHAALYARLSREDGDKEESDSIANQKSLIKNWLLGRQDIRLCMECADDGWSGPILTARILNAWCRRLKQGT